MQCRAGNASRTLAFALSSPSSPLTRAIVMQHAELAGSTTAPSFRRRGRRRRAVDNGITAAPIAAEVVALLARPSSPAPSPDRSLATP
jgi:hypothetical protein